MCLPCCVRKRESENALPLENKAQKCCLLKRCEKIREFFRDICAWLRERCCCTRRGISTDSTTANLKNDKVIVHFADGAPLYDKTAAKIVKIVPEQQVNLLDGKTVTLCEQIYLGEGKVLFSLNLNERLLFSKAAYTEWVSVEDANEVGVYKITEKDTRNKDENQWVVNTGKKFYIQSHAFEGVMVGRGELAYLVESKMPDNYDTLQVGSIMYEPPHNDQILPKVLFKG